MNLRLQLEATQLVNGVELPALVQSFDPPHAWLRGQCGPPATSLLNVLLLGTDGSQGSLRV